MVDGSWLLKRIEPEEARLIPLDPIGAGTEADLPVSAEAAGTRSVRVGRLGGNISPADAGTALAWLENEFLLPASWTNVASSSLEDDRSCF